VVGRHLPVKVKMDGVVGYGLGFISEQSVHEVVSGIRDAVNRVTDVQILLLFVPTLQFLNAQTTSVKFTTKKFYTEGQAVSVR
jgi:hypothetical protein